MTVAFTELWMEQDLPTILTLLSKRVVSFDRKELRDSKIYLDLSPNFGYSLPPSVITILLDLWLMTGTNIVFRIILSSHIAEDALVGIMNVVIVVMSAETRVFCPTSLLVRPSVSLLFISMIACMKISWDGSENSIMPDLETKCENLFSRAMALFKLVWACVARVVVSLTPSRSEPKSWMSPRMNLSLMILF